MDTVPRAANQARSPRALGRTVSPPLPGARAPYPGYTVDAKAMAALKQLYDRSSSVAQAINADSQLWLEHRIREYVNVHGYASSGVCALLRRAAAAYADADYLRALGYANEDAALTLKALSAGTAAKSYELAAYEIAVREGRAKREQDAMRESGAGKLARALAEQPSDLTVAGWAGAGTDDVRPPLDAPPGGSMSGAPFPAQTPPTESES